MGVLNLSRWVKIADCSDGIVEDGRYLWQNWKGGDPLFAGCLFVECGIDFVFQWLQPRFSVFENGVQAMEVLLAGKFAAAIAGPADSAECNEPGDAEGGGWYTCL